MFSDSDRNIIASLAHEACEFHCDDCDACLEEDDLDPHYGTCEECTPLPDCLAIRPQVEWRDYDLKNCPCATCDEERLLERAKQSDPERWASL